MYVGSLIIHVMHPIQFWYSEKTACWCVWIRRLLSYNSGAIPFGSKPYTRFFYIVDDPPRYPKSTIPRSQDPLALPYPTQTRALRSTFT